MSGHVYRAFDADGRLLYVGCTRNPEKRMREHRDASPWWPYATDVTFDGPWSVHTARALEQVAIDTETPWFNTTAAEQGELTRMSMCAKRYVRARRTWRETPEQLTDLRHKAALHSTALYPCAPTKEFKLAAYLHLTSERAA